MSPSLPSESRSHRAARQARAALNRASRRAVMTAAVALGATFLMNAQALAAPAVGQQAPDFIAVDTAGKQHRLSDFAGKYVVLEWTNPGCPFVRAGLELPAAAHPAFVQSASQASRPASRARRMRPR